MQGGEYAGPKRSDIGKLRTSLGGSSGAAPFFFSGIYSREVETLLDYSHDIIRARSELCGHCLSQVRVDSAVRSRRDDKCVIRGSCEICARQDIAIAPGIGIEGTDVGTPEAFFRKAGRCTDVRKITVKVRFQAASGQDAADIP